jgi:serine/threonine protein kinase
LYAIMPYLPSTELFGHVAANGPQPADEVRSFLRQMVSAMGAMRASGVAHRDMSLENTLVVAREEEPAQYVVIDFGMARRVNLLVVEDEYTRRHGRFSVFHPGACGKCPYIAPEIIANAPPPPELLEEDRDFYEEEDRYWVDLFQADMWALGVMLFRFSTSLVPMQTAAPTDQCFRLVAAGRLRELIAHWKLDLDPQLQDLLTRLLEVDPLKRITLEGVAAHPFLHH